MAEHEYIPGSGGPHHHARQATRCSGCDAPMAADQRYCLQCGARRGEPRIDFSAFWRAPAAAAEYGQRSRAAGSGWQWSAPGLPSLRARGALVVGVLAAGIGVGAAVGPATSAGTGAASARLSPGLLAAVVPPPAATATAGSQTTTTESTQTRRYLRRRKSSSSAVGSLNASENTTTTTTQTAPAVDTKPSHHHGRITHVWVIALGQGSFAQARTEPNVLPYLDGTLVPEGALLADYSLVAHSSLANDIALLSGQGPNTATEEGCPTYTPVSPPAVSSGGLASGTGCIYPGAVQTLAGQLAEHHLTWRAYAQDMSQSATAGAAALNGTATPATSTTSTTTTTTTTGSTAAGGTTCVHPVSGEATPNPTPVEGADYVALRNPFVYFDSLLEGGACTADDVDGNALSRELIAPAGPPALSWVIPDQCDDGLSDPCAAPGEAPAVLPVNTFLSGVVHEITATKAYSEHGMIVITFDRAPATSSSADVGGLVLSPFVTKASRIKSSFDEFSLLKTFERLFELPPLGHAADPGVAVLGDRVLHPGATR